MLNKNWDIVLNDLLHSSVYHKLDNFIKKEYQTKTIFPSYNNIFKAFKLTDYDEVKVVILGQDPYHGENEAEGFSFSVPNNVKRPPSLQNIYKELNSDLKIERSNNNLDDWAKEGVFLLNSVLTVVKDSPLSHKNCGWEAFTDQVIVKLNNSDKPLVFILWGNYAKSKKHLINNEKHLIIESAHPSPLSAHRGFFGSKPFSKTNQYLIKNNIKPINW